MAPQTDDDKTVRLERVREIVLDDYTRIAQATSPFQILNVPEQELLDVVESRYDRYERFYRAENFQRLGDIDLTRKALEIRKSLGRAMDQVRRLQGHQASRDQSSSSHDVRLFVLDEDKAAMADIYFRDALTYIHLGDLGEAYTLLRRSVDYLATRGIVLAYLGYVLFKKQGYEPTASDETRGLLDRAASLDSRDPDIFVLRARFFAKLGELEQLRAAISHIELIDPVHPMLDRLQRKARQLQS